MAGREGEHARFIRRSIGRPDGSAMVDSNYAKICLARAQKPGAPVWVAAAPSSPRLTPAAYITAVADAGAWGGAWISTLDDKLAASIASDDSEALRTWDQIKQGANFFYARKKWLTYQPDAVLGIVSDFAGSNEFLGQELVKSDYSNGSAISGDPGEGVE